MKCPKCGNNEFDAHQRAYHDIVVDGNNMFLRDENIYESETPYGPYTCTKCETVYDELPTGE